MPSNKKIDSKNILPYNEYRQLLKKRRAEEKGGLGFIDRESVKPLEPQYHNQIEITTENVNPLNPNKKPSNRPTEGKFTDKFRLKFCKCIG